MYLFGNIFDYIRIFFIFSMSEDIYYVSYIFTVALDSCINVWYPK